MDRKLSDWLRRASTGRVALAALLIFALFTGLVLPRQAISARQEAGDAGSPDTSFLYAPDDLYRMAEAYGQPGRRAYVRARFTFDLVWPAVYTLFLLTATSWALGRGFPLDSRWQRANLAPLGGALFDLLENLSTSLVMVRYPSRTPVAALLAPWFTALKWVAIGASFALVLTGLLAMAWRRWVGAGGSR